MMWLLPSTMRAAQGGRTREEIEALLKEAGTKWEDNACRNVNQVIKNG